MPAAAVATSKLIHTFRPRYVAMAGIAGGVRGQVGIGDVIVGKSNVGLWMRKMGERRWRTAFSPAPHRFPFQGRYGRS